LLVLGGTLQHNAAHCSTLHHPARTYDPATHGNTWQQTATNRTEALLILGDTQQLQQSASSCKLQQTASCNTCNALE